MKKVLLSLAVMLSPTVAFAQLPCSEVPGQGFYCKTQMTFTGGMELPPTSTVAQLPVCNAASQGQIRQVSDATAPAYNATIAGSGAVITMVYCNGTNWTAH